MVWFCSAIKYDQTSLGKGISEMTISEKPLGESLGWKIEKAVEPSVCSWFAIRQFELKRNQQHGTYTYMVLPGSALVVPITANGNFLLQQTYRFTIDPGPGRFPLER